MTTLFLVTAGISLAFGTVDGWSKHLAQVAELSGGLRLVANVDKPDLAIGDSVHITGTIWNTSSTAVVLYKGGGNYRAEIIRLRTQEGTVLRTVHKVLLDIFPPTREGFVDLKPGASWTLSFHGTVRSGKVLDVRGRQSTEVTGVFLEFGDSAVLIPSGGVYDLTIEVEHDRAWLEGAAQFFGIPNLWYGRLTSPPVRIMFRFPGRAASPAVPPDKLSRK